MNSITGNLFYKLPLMLGNAYWQRRSKWMREQSEIDGTLLNLVSLTDLIKGETKATTKRKKG